MAARRRRVNLDETWREKIQTSMLINRLQDEALGKIELTDGQRKSIEILLRKSAPDLQSVTIGGDEENPLVIEHGRAREFIARRILEVATAAAAGEDSQPADTGSIH